MSFVDLFGETLLTKGCEKKSTAEVLAGKKAVAIYFSAHWCPPCRGFTPKLAEWYTEDLQKKGMEVVFVSSDREESGFKEYFGEMPWLALPYEDRERKAALSKKFKCQGIPHLVILDGEGKKITLDGRSAVSKDPKGEKFPWIPVPPKQLLAQMKLKKGSEDVSLQTALQGKKGVALYFSAHWCPPCRGFTPKMAEWYTKDLAAKGLEVIFISSDRDEAAFADYFKEMPWLAMDFAQRELKSDISDAFGVEGIPSLVILDTELNVINKEGRAAVSSDPEGKELPWFPKPVGNLKGGPGNINEIPLVIAFCEGSSAEEQKGIEAVLTPFGEECMKKAKETDDDPELEFTMATEGDGLVNQLKGMMGLEGKDKKLALVDVPAGMKYHLVSGDSIDTSTVQKLLADYKAGSLDMKDLQQ